MKRASFRHAGLDPESMKRLDSGFHRNDERFDITFVERSQTMHQGFSPVTIHTGLAASMRRLKGMGLPRLTWI